MKPASDSSGTTAVPSVTPDDGRAFAAEHNLATLPSPLPGFPGISFIYAGTVSGSAEFSGWGGGDPNLNVENRFQWSDNLSWTHGRHSVKTGVDLRRQRFDVLKGGVGSFVFASTFTSSSNAPGSGLPYADYLYGYPTTEAGNGNAMLDWGRQRSIYAGGFVQDDWKVTNSLTLNIGIRYELFTQCVDARNLGSLFNIKNGQFALPGRDGYSPAIVNGDHNNFGPRAGFAWQASKKLVLRGGYGLFYGERDQNQQVTQFSGNFPERAGHRLTHHHSAEHREAALHRQYSDPDRGRERVTGGIHSRLALRRDHPFAGVRSVRRSHGAPI